jgi:hypothetical protein
MPPVTAAQVDPSSAIRATVAARHLLHARFLDPLTDNQVGGTGRARFNRANHTPALERTAATHDIARVANDPRVQRAIQIVMILLFVAVAGMIALAAALLRG